MASGVEVAALVNNALCSRIKSLTGPAYGTTPWSFDGKTYHELCRFEGITGEVEAMKRRRSPERQQADLPRGLSESEVEEMVSRKVSAVLKNQDSTLQALQQKLTEMEESNFEEKFKQLKAHIQKVKRRGDAAIAYMKQLRAQGRIVPALQSTAAGAVANSRNMVGGDDSSDCPDVISGDADGQSRRQPVEGFWQGRRSKIQVVDLTSEDFFVGSTELSCQVGRPITEEDRTIPMEKCQVSSSSQTGQPSSSDPPPHHISAPQTTLEEGPASSLPTVKEEPQMPVAIKIKTEESTHDPPSPLSEDGQKSPPPSVKEEPATPKAITVAVKTEEVPQVELQKPKDDWKTKLHPLPETPFPKSLPFDATTKNVPQKLTLLLRRHLDSGEKGIYVKVEVEQVDRYMAEMDSYYFYGAQESTNGNFSRWRLIGHIRAVPLPMFFHLNSSDGNRRLFFTIVGKDKYGRYGPYSDIAFI
ncbi:hypothetical protein ACEWY4_003648 [Coilia grayii]|uniref:Activating transcription factor 7-interacting protein Fn3 domain-containing protein n=1 Tax=Coilia grayii TaxID=363190 RepID=A0ABD1KRT9_9TELE